MSKGVSKVFGAIVVIALVVFFIKAPGHMDVGWLGFIYALSLILGVCSVLYFTISAPDHHD